MTERHPSPPPYATVIFDCDSTLSTIEGVEELAGDLQFKIHQLTERVMGGEQPLESVFGERLELIRPSADDVARVGKRYVETLVPNARELVKALDYLSKPVHIVSGGLMGAVRVLAGELGLGAANVHAVQVLHDESGAYVDFDRDSPLARAGGKLEVIEALAHGRHAVPPLVLVGDGATDLEAAPACARFIAYGGVVRRESVFAGADVTCEVPDMAALLHLLVDGQEFERLNAHPDHRPLVAAARALRR